MLLSILTTYVITSCSVTLMLFLHLEVKPLMTLIHLHKPSQSPTSQPQHAFPHQPGSPHRLSEQPPDTCTVERGKRQQRCDFQALKPACPRQRQPGQWKYLQRMNRKEVRHAQVAV